MALPRYEIKRDSRGEYRFNLLSVNGENILRSSEGYTYKSDCQRAIAICQENSPHEQYYNRGQSGTNYWFTLRAKNGEDIGISEMYASSYNRENGIAAVKRDGSTKNVEDKS